MSPSSKLVSSTIGGRRRMAALPTAASLVVLAAFFFGFAALLCARTGRFGALQVRPRSDPREPVGSLSQKKGRITGINGTHSNLESSGSSVHSASIQLSNTLAGSEDMGVDASPAMAVVPRAFVVYPHPFPCYLPRPDDQLLRRAWQDQAPATQGLLYEKPNKCASTTLAGVNLRMARNAAQRLQWQPRPNSALNGTLCDVRWSHGRRQRGERYGHRNKTKSFLWSAVRDPTSRAVSWYHFKHLSLDGHKNQTDRDFQDYLLRQNDHFYLSFLNTRPYTIRTWIDAVTELNFVLDEYDFIGVTERLDESLVVLMLLLRVPMADMLYYSSKVHAGLFARAPRTPCYYLQPSVVSDEMTEFFASDAWNNKIRSDAEFYRAVNRSLDLTIDELGKDRVSAELVRFQRAQALVRDRCQGKVRMPCDRPGGMARPVEDTDCMVGDVGCGMECLDSVATELGLWTYQEVRAKRGT